MQKYKALILTDHSNHSSENSLYDLATKLYLHPKTDRVDIVSKASDSNHGFFNMKESHNLFAATVNEGFKFNGIDHPLDSKLKSIDPDTYDLIWLRLPPPISKEFLYFLSIRFRTKVIINNPNGIYQTGSKEFLTNFRSVCPPLKVCKSLSDIIQFKNEFPIVLKPFRAYGGSGLIRIDRDVVWSGKEKMTFSEFEKSYNGNEYLGVKYLKNVYQGDKRIVVVNGEILGASLRLPAKNSWICNVAMGGSSNKTDITKEENEIVETINPSLKEMGIVMYGVDTLVGDDGKRVLSELNTTSIGGLPQIAQMNNEPLVELAIDLIWNYYETKVNG